MAESQPETITKKELVHRIAEKTGHTKVMVKDIVQMFLEAMVDELALGNRLEFREFGVFEVRERSARVAQNPRTLERVTVPARRVVKFKVGRGMRERVCDEPMARKAAAAAARAVPVPQPPPPSGRKPAATKPAPPKPPPTTPNSPF